MRRTTRHRRVVFRPGRSTSRRTPFTCRFTGRHRPSAPSPDTPDRRRSSMLPVPRRRHRLPAILAAAALTGASLGPAQAGEPGQTFQRLATYPVFQNRPAGVDPAAPDGRRDLGGQRGRPHAHLHRRARAADRLRRHHATRRTRGPGHARPAPTLGHRRATSRRRSPSSAAYVLVVVDTPAATSPTPIGRLDVVGLADRTRGPHASTSAASPTRSR